MAFRNLEQLASERSRTLFVRALRPPAQDWVPLNLMFGLTSDDDKRVFAHPPIVVQPLPRTSYAAGGRCISKFVYVLPDQLAGADPEPLPAELSGSPDLKRDWQAFTTYMAGTPEDSAAGGTLLLILAHHAGARLSFDNVEKWSVDGFNRTLGDGSATVLVACSSSDHPEAHESLVRAFNDRDVDAVIVAPYDIPTEAGVLFARQFAIAVEDAREHHLQATLAELLAQAVENSSAKLAADQTRDITAVREFFLAGNGGLHLCASPPSASSSSSPRSQD